MDIVLGGDVTTSLHVSVSKTPPNDQRVYLDRISVALTDRRGTPVTAFETLDANEYCDASNSCGFILRRATPSFNAVQAYGNKSG